MALPCSLVGGAAWFGLLAFGVISEQIKTRRELAEERDGTKVGGGSSSLFWPAGVCCMLPEAVGAAALGSPCRGETWYWAQPKGGRRKYKWVGARKPLP